MSARIRLTVGIGVTLAVAGVALAGPLHLRQRAAAMYRCSVPLPVQRALRGGPSWTVHRADARTEALEDVSERLTTLETRSFVVIQDGHTVFESYERCHGPFVPHYAASASKALVGGLITAIALDSGWVDLDTPAHEWVPLLAERDRSDEITLRTLGTHASGLDEASVGGEIGPGLPGWKGRFWGSTESRWEVALADTPLRFEPGSRYLYSNPAMAVFGYALSTAVADGWGRGLDQVMAEMLMRPLGIDDDEWKISDGRSYSVGGRQLYRIGGGAVFSARAMSALGQLMLEDGSVGDASLVSPEALRAVSRYGGLPPASTLAGNPAPGIGWHTNAVGTFPSLPKDAFLAAGAEHQVLLVVPSRDLVVVRSGGSLGGPQWGPGYWSRLEAEIFQPVMAALEGS